jgi:hypothetical protein
MAQPEQSSRPPAAHGGGEAKLPPLAARSRGCGAWDKLAIAALVLAALAATFTYEQDFDAFWHVASGKWMLQHQHVLDFDPFTSQPDDPSTVWVNVYWLFQVVIASLQSVAGWPAITVLQSLLTGAAFALFALSLRKQVPTAWLVLTGLLMLPVFASRVRMRPEMFTLPFLTAAVVLVDEVRRGASARKLWWFVPMMLCWVNMHGLYFLGLVVMWGAMLGAVLDRRLGRRALVGNLPTQAGLAPMLAATAACLVSPWPLEAALHPLVLWTRISGESFIYTYGVSEFRPTWEGLSSQPEMLVLVGLTGVVLLLNVRRVPLSHAIWVAPFLVLAAMAVRNIALLAPVCGLPLAWHGGSLLARLSAHRPRRERLAPVASAAALLLALAVAAGYATEYLHRVRQQITRTGAGLCPNYYATGLAQYLGALKAPGDVLAVNFGDASSYIYYSFPARKVWMDGRLEIHTLKRFQEYNEVVKELRTSRGADSLRWPDSARSVRFISVLHDDDEHLIALANSRRFRLIRLDPAGALFERTDWDDGRPPQEIADELPARANLEDFDRPLLKDGLVEGMSPTPRPWYRQNSVSRFYQFGTMLLPLGQTPAASANGQASPWQRRCALLAARYLEAARSEGTASPDTARGALAESLQQWAGETGEEASAELPLDVDVARALYLYSQTDLAKLAVARRWVLGMAHLRCLMQGRHLDAAAREADAFVKVLPPQDQLFPPDDYISMRNALRAKLDEVHAAMMGADLGRMSPPDRAKWLTAPQRGLTLEAIAGLRSAPNLSAEGRMMLADLLLRVGRPAEAREACRSASAGGAEAGAVALRLALCDWVEGDLWRALDSLGGLDGLDGAGAQGPASRPSPRAGSSPRDDPLREYYRARLLEEMGYYPQARDALRAAAAGASPELAKLIEQARGRM